MRTLRSTFLASLLLASACDDGSPAPTQEAANACVPDAAGAAWTFDLAAAAGPHLVGRISRTYVDDSRPTPPNGSAYPGDSVRSLPTEVYYPSLVEGDEVEASDAGPFPVVLYSHGFSSGNFENPELLRLLASHGYVVVAPRFPLSSLGAPGGPTAADLPNQPGDLSFLLDRMIALDSTPGDLLEGAIDETRVAAVGLSLGGLTTLLVTYHARLRDPRIDVAVAAAPPASMFLPTYFDTTTAPLLVLFGELDAIVSYDPNATTLQSNVRSPMSLLTLSGGTHTGFTSVSRLVEGAEGYENADTLGCTALGAGTGERPMFDYEALLGGSDVGIANPPYSGEFCPSPLAPGMAPSRQLTIEGAAVRAFLDSYLSNDATTRGRACHFSSRVLPRQDDLDLFVR